MSEWCVVKGKYLKRLKVFLVLLVGVWGVDSSYLPIPLVLTIRYLRIANGLLLRLSRVTEAKNLRGRLRPRLHLA